MTPAKAKFGVGQLIRHKLFDYRGVVIDVDAKFLGSEQWYREMARSRPPKDRPWYHVLVDGAGHRTYVAERNLEADATAAPIRHPHVSEFFSGIAGGRYVPLRKGN